MLEILLAGASKRLERLDKRGSYEDFGKEEKSVYVSSFIILNSKGG